MHEAKSFRACLLRWFLTFDVLLLVILLTAGAPSVKSLDNYLAANRNPRINNRLCTSCCAGLTNSQIASSVFSAGTVAVLPFYTLMVVAPKTELTRKAVECSIPYILLGVLYAYLLYLSWTPETVRLIFASQYWLPELPGIAKMFASEMTLASAWIHLLAVDLYAARQVFLDGLENEVDTRLSVSFCLLFCPIGIVAHYITKALTRRARSTGCRRVH